MRDRRRQEAGLPRGLSVGRIPQGGALGRCPGERPGLCLSCPGPRGQGYQLGVLGPEVPEVTSGCAGAGTWQAAHWAPAVATRPTA